MPLIVGRGAAAGTVGMHAGAAGVAVTYIGPNLRQAQGDFSPPRLHVWTLDADARVCTSRVRLMLRVSAEAWDLGGVDF